MTAFSTRYRDLPIRRREVITRADIDALAARNQQSITVGEHCTITDEAREHALKLGIPVQYGDVKAKTPAPAATPPSAPPASPRRPVAEETAGAGMSEAIVAVLREMKLQPTEEIIRLVIERVSTALAAPRA